MGWFKNIFTWWEGATFGTWVDTKARGMAMGEDALGNRYFQGKQLPSGRPRRWVVYAGSNDASRVPPEWHGWLHNTVEATPDQALPPPRIWEKPAEPNLTGTEQAYRPGGAPESGRVRAAATGDYEAWTPDAA